MILSRSPRVIYSSSKCTYLTGLPVLHSGTAPQGAIFAVTKGHSNVGLKGGQKTVSPMEKACFRA
jgi:hypothetical protein